MIIRQTWHALTIFLLMLFGLLSVSIGDEPLPNAKPAPVFTQSYSIPREDFAAVASMLNNIYAGSVVEEDPLAGKIQVQATKDEHVKITRFVKDAEDPEGALTRTCRLLDNLKNYNADQTRFTDLWCQTLKDLVDVGPDAVPFLIAELDATSNDMMMRCLGFILRAIGDKRAVPALIRAIPKTLVPPGSDMGLTSNDPDLLKFAQTFDLDPEHRRNQYGFGRPVREICGALQKLTGKEHDVEELFHVFQGGSASQQQRQRVLFHRNAEKWAQWWGENWADFVKDEKYSNVHLEKQEEEELFAPPSPDSHFKTGGGSSNWILESVLNPKSRTVFYDLDIGRAAPLPEKWRNEKEIESHEKEILFWATREGFDLMGTEYETADGRKLFALRSIGLQVWELGKHRWKMNTADITLKELQAEGRFAEKLLFHYDEKTKSQAPLEPASFLFVTRHGTPGLLFVGIEVQDDSLKPGGIARGDNELNPVAFRKGRRFGYKNLEEINP